MNRMHRDRQTFALARPRALSVRAAPRADQEVTAASGRRPNGPTHRRLGLLSVLCALALSGCNAWQPATYTPPSFGFGLGPDYVAPQTAPLMVNNMNSDFVWDEVVDVVDDYFRVRHEERVRLVGDLLTEGHLSTYPRGASTIFEPWNRDSITPYERWQATLQSMRRQAEVIVLPVEGGFTVDVRVYKELEDVARPESGAVSLANSQTLRNDDALIRLTNPVGGQEPTRGWIGLGRDIALEQVILAGIQARTGGTFIPVEQVPVPTEQIPTEQIPAGVPAIPAGLRN